MRSPWQIRGTLKQQEASRASNQACHTHTHCTQALAPLLAYTTPTLPHKLVLHQGALAFLCTHTAHTCGALAVHTHSLTPQGLGNAHIPAACECRSLHAQIRLELKVGQLLGQLSSRAPPSPLPPSLPSDLTWIQGCRSGWQQAEVHLAEVNSVVEGRKKHPPEGHHSSHQRVDREEKESGHAEHAPEGREGKGSGRPRPESCARPGSQLHAHRHCCYPATDIYWVGFCTSQGNQSLLTGVFLYHSSTSFF